MRSKETQEDARTIIAIAGFEFAIGIHTWPGSSAAEIVAVNGFFATLFALAGLLFRFVALKQPSAGAH